MSEEICYKCQGTGGTEIEQCELCKGTGKIKTGKPTSPQNPVGGVQEGERYILSKNERAAINTQLSELQSRLLEAEVIRDNEIAKRKANILHYDKEIEAFRGRAMKAEEEKKIIQGQMNGMQANVDNMYILDRRVKDMDKELAIERNKNGLILEKIRFLLETIQEADKIYGHIKSVPECIKAMQDTVKKQVLLRDEQIERGNE